MTTDSDRFERLYVEQVLPFGRIRTKDAHPWVWKTLGWLLFVFSFGNVRNFTTGVTTTIADTVYFPKGWRMCRATNEDLLILFHEVEHIKQFRKLGFGNVKLGFLFFCILYFLIPLPVGLAWFRYYFEREAYATHRVTNRRYKMGLTFSLTKLVDILTGPKYLWAWPFRKSVRRWATRRMLEDQYGKPV